MNKAWIIYDGRAETEDEDDCAVIEVACTRRDLRDMLYHNRGADGVLFEYDDEGKQLLNPRKIGHLREGKALLARCFQESRS